MTELEGFDSRYGALFADLVTLARALGVEPSAAESNPNPTAVSSAAGGRAG